MGTRPNGAAIEESYAKNWSSIILNWGRFAYQPCIPKDRERDSW